MGLAIQDSFFTAGGWRVGQRQKGPVAFVLGALLDPAAEDRDLIGGEVRLFAGRGRHVLVGVGRGDPLDERAFVGLAGNDGRVAAEIGGGSVAEVEAQIGLAMLGVGSVAIKAVAREDGSDVLVEADFFGRSGGAVDAERLETWHRLAT